MTILLPILIAGKYLLFIQVCLNHGLQRPIGKELAVHEQSGPWMVKVIHASSEAITLIIEYYNSDAQSLRTRILF